MSLLCLIDQCVCCVQIAKELSRNMIAADDLSEYIAQSIAR